MALILATDTSMRASGVSFYDSEKNRYHTKIADQDRMRAEELLGLVRDLQKETGFELEAIDAFAVSLGPGSFTGLRIGLTMLKTMAQFTKKPLLGISSLKALAWAAGTDARVEEESLLLPVIDARANRIYAAAYRKKGDELELLLKEDLYQEEDLLKRLTRLGPTWEEAAANPAIPSAIWAGEGIQKHKKLLSLEKSLALDGPAMASPIEAIGYLAGQRLLKGEEDSALDLLPHYLRKSQAELQREGRQG